MRINTATGIVSPLLTFVLTFLLQFGVAAAQGASQTDKDSQTADANTAEASLAQAINETDVASLIELLESESARQEFLTRLKALAKAQEGEQGKSLAVSELLDLENSSGALADNYTQLLNHLGLTDSQFGKVVTGLAALLLLVLLLLLVRLLGSFIDRKLNPARARFHLPKHRLQLLTKLPIKFCYALAIILGFAAAAEIWQLSWLLPGGKLAYPDLLSFVLTFAVILYIFAGIWEASNALLEYAMHRSRHMSDSRIDTILPIIQKVILVFLLLLFGLVALSELGINIMPLLAGAGVFGIALGFGAQTLVRDFLVGFTIILEDLVQIGDIVKVADRMGEVEKITIRKLQLRSLDGTVHTIPFSELDIIENFTKEFSYYLTDIGVAYKEDVDQVIECIETVSRKLKEDETFGEMMLANIEILGLDKFADSAIVIRARLKTRAHDKWRLGREFNRRLKYAFDKEGIEIPFPHRTLMLGENIGEKFQAQT